MKGIFYNSQKAMCSIYESGLMCYNALKLSSKYELHYSEDRILYFNYDFIVVNEHLAVNNWISKVMLEQYNKPAFCIVTEVGLLNDDILIKSPNYYTAYIILDPTIRERDNIYAFGRPIEKNNNTNNLDILDYKTCDKPIIGSFGLPTPGKDWNRILYQVNQEFDEAIIRFNIPRGSHVPIHVGNEIIRQINKNYINKPGITFELTHIDYNKEDLIEWCSKNTINVFFYFRQHMYYAGLAAVADQAISSGRPLLITNDNTFRHIHKYIDCFPNIGIKKAIEETEEGVKKMREDWSAENFVNKFETILDKFISPI